MPPRKKTQKETISKRKKPESPIMANTAPKKTTTSKQNDGKKRTKSLAAMRRRQYSIGSADAGTNVHYYNFTGKQTKSWKPVGKQLKDYLYHMIDSCVKMVASKSCFSRNDHVQQMLSELKLQLKAKMHSVKVPSKKHGDYSKLKAQTVDLKEQLETLLQHKLLLEKSAREEERAIESLEELQSSKNSVQLMLKTPADILDQPKLTS